MRSGGSALTRKAHRCGISSASTASTPTRLLTVSNDVAPAGQVTAIASHHNARRSKRISRNSHRAATELQQKLEENRKNIEDRKKGGHDKKAGMTVKERIAARKKAAAVMEECRQAGGPHMPNSLAVGG